MKINLYYYDGTIKTRDAFVKEYEEYDEVTILPEEIGRNVQYAEIDPEYFVAEVGDEGYMLSSASFISNTALLYFNEKAVKLRLIPYNPCEAAELPKLKKYHASVYPPSMIQNLLDTASDTDMFLAVFLLVMVGLRRGELLALRWSDIDFRNKVIKVRSNMVNGENGCIIKAPKSEAGIRDIHVGDDVITILKQARTQYVADASDYGIGVQNLNFVIHQKDGSPIKPDSMTQKWQRFLKTHKLPKIRLHDLRHSNATALIQAGVNPRVVQQRLGHSDVNITLNTYTHVLPEMDVEAAEKLESILLKRAQ